MQQTDKRQQQEEGEQPVIADGRTPDDEPHLGEEPDSNQQIARYTQVVARWTKALVGVGILTAVAIFLQFWSFVRSERAFIFPSSIRFTERLATAKTQPILLSIEITNYGKSIAKVDGLIAFVIHELPMPAPSLDRMENGLEISYPPIPANGKFEQQKNFDRWGRETMLAVRNGTLPFHIFGRVTYEGEYSTFWGLPFFGVRTSDFCFAYISNPDDPSKAFFRSCPQPSYTKTQ